MNRKTTKFMKMNKELQPQSNALNVYDSTKNDG